MRVLVVFAHPKRDSFTGRLLDSFAQGLEEAGHDVEIADLYGEGFQPLLVPDDYAQWQARPMPDDVLREQARVERADGIALVFPVWWWSMPAMLKGWFDRVFSAGWAYAEEYDPEEVFSHPASGSSSARPGARSSSTGSTATTRRFAISSRSAR